MENKRSQDQIVTQAPILVSLGGKQYQIKPLAIKESRGWRKKFAEVLGTLPLFVKPTATPKQFNEVINGMFLDVPDKIMDLIFEYAKDLPREEIEAVATDAEMAKVFESILEVAFPLARSMVAATTTLSQ